MTLLAGLDLNATRARAVAGASGAAPRSVALEEPDAALPLALSLEGRRVEVGRTALRIARRLPHLTCTTFLPYLGTHRLWTTPRHRLDAAQALIFALRQLHAVLADATGLVVALPIYLSTEQASLFARLASQAQLPLLNWVAAPLAAAGQAREQRPWFGPALVLDVDDYALCWAVVHVEEPPAPQEIRIVAEQIAPALSLRVWKERLLTGIADRCVRQSRRDPRASGEAEQMLHDQLDKALKACCQEAWVPLAVQSDHWYHELVLHPAELRQYCAGLVRHTLTDLRQLLTVAQIEQPPVLLLATATAACLPGLLTALEHQFGPRLRVVTLTEDAVAVGAHDLAIRCQQGDLPTQPMRQVLPLRDGARGNGAPTPSPSPGTHASRIPFWGPRRLSKE